MASTVYETFIREGIDLQAAGDDEGALAVRLKAFETAEDDFDRGRAEREVAASLGRLGRVEEALNYTDQSWDHLEGYPGMRARRESAATASQTGQLLLKRAIDTERAGELNRIREEEALEWLQRAYAAITACEDRRPDQYGVTMLRRVTAAEGLYGERSKAIRLGIRAVLLGFVAESSHLIDNTDTTMDLWRKTRVRVRTTAGGASALISSALTTEERGTVRRRAALWFADRAV
jgi:hypothetical protein